MHTALWCLTQAPTPEKVDILKQEFGLVQVRHMWQRPTIRGMIEFQQEVDADGAFVPRTVVQQVHSILEAGNGPLRSMAIYVDNDGLWTPLARYLRDELLLVRPRRNRPIPTTIVT